MITFSLGRQSAVARFSRFSRFSIDEALLFQPVGGMQAMTTVFQRVSWFSLVVIGVFLGGCAGESGPAGPPPVPVSEQSRPVEHVADTATDTATGTANDKVATRRKYGGLSFEIPSTWREIPDAPMVDSKFVISTEQGDCEMTLTTMGGGLEANLERWVGQIQQEPGDEPEWTTLSVAGVDSRMVDVRGAFHSNVGPNPGRKENWRLIGIAVPQDRDFFVKLLGPREAITELQDQLNEFLKTGEANK
jgi:hypothetical protein